MICRDMSTVVQMARSTGRDCITLEGDTSSSKGVLAGGYLDKAKSRMAGWRKYRKLCGKVQDLKDQLSRLGIQRDGLLKSESRVAEKMEEVQRNVREMEAELLEMEERLRVEGTSRELRSVVRAGEEQLGRLVSELRVLRHSAEELESELRMPEMEAEVL